jgi:hypothetical protein
MVSNIGRDNEELEDKILFISFFYDIVLENDEQTVTWIILKTKIAP